MPGGGGVHGHAHGLHRHPLHAEGQLGTGERVRPLLEVEGLGRIRVCDHGRERLRHGRRFGELPVKLGLKHIERIRLC